MGQQQTFQWKRSWAPTIPSIGTSLCGQGPERMLEHGITTIRVGEFAWNLTEPEEGACSP